MQLMSWNNSNSFFPLITELTDTARARPVGVISASMTKLLSMLIIVCVSVSASAASKAPASIQELMQSQVDPAADAIWESVSTVTSAAGIEEHQPRTEEEWNGVRRHAISLIEAAKSLAVEGRPVVREGKQVEDAHVPGVLPAAQIEQTIAKNRGAFAAYARSLHDVSLELLRAIDARNSAALLEAGGHLEGVCEACHLQYWYPEAKRPTAHGTP